MKIILVLIMFCTLNVNSQSITLTFNGLQSGSENVLIENLTNGTSATVTGVNYINLSISSVSDIDNSKFKSFPNPFINEVFFEFNANGSSSVDIIITNQLGQVIIQHKEKLKNDYNKMKFNAPIRGVYFVQIVGKNINTSFSILCEDANNSSAKIELVNSKQIFKSTNKSVNNITFSYGDILRYTATNNNINSIITDAPTGSKTYDFIFDCIDYHNYAYKIAKVGTQWWMAENLKSTKYANGTNISGSYVYNNSSSNENIYGRLYTWAAVMNGATGNNNIPSGVQGVCPNGWHVPSEDEWDIMRDELGGKIAMHGKVKEVGTEHWNAPNSDATDEVGLSVLPGGIRWEDAGYQYFREQGFFWNTTDDSSGLDVIHASGYTFFNDTDDYYMYTWNEKTSAQSVRCVRD